MNPSYDSRTKALDSIFNPDELGEMVLVIDRSEWNKHLEYCDIDMGHEESVIAKGFYFAKDNKEWFFKDIGFRIRGNTSRIRPQDFIHCTTNYPIPSVEAGSTSSKAAPAAEKPPPCASLRACLLPMQAVYCWAARILPLRRRRSGILYQIRRHP